MKVLVKSRLINVARKSTCAIWRKCPVDRIFENRAAAAAEYDLRKCHYVFLDISGNEVREVDNARLDSFGNRIKY